MHVSELVDLVADLSFGRVSTTIKERNIYLRFLNIANLEMWQIAVNATELLTPIEVFFDDGQYDASIPSGYYLKAVFVDKKPLVKCKLEKIFDIPRGEYSLINNQLSISQSEILLQKTDPIDGVTKRYITVLMLENAKTLVETITDTVDQIDTPVYPNPYHIGLVQGALFYLYTSNKGFAEKIRFQILAWEECKKSLASYYS